MPDRRDTPRARRARAGCGPRLRFWGFLIDRIDARIAVSPMAAESAARWLPGDYQRDPERRRSCPRRRIPPTATTRSSSSAATTRARGCRRCCARGREIHRRDRRAPEADRHRPDAVPAAACAHALRRGRDRRARHRHERGADARARCARRCPSHPRSAERASGSCSPRRSRARRRRWRRTSRATRPSRARRRRGSCRRVTRMRSPRR